MSKEDDIRKNVREMSKTLKVLDREVFSDDHIMEPETKDNVVIPI